MKESLQKESMELTMVAHTKVIQTIVHNCYQLVVHNYTRISHNYTNKSPLDITIDEFNKASMYCTGIACIGNDVAYLFPDDKSLVDFSSTGQRSSKLFKKGYIYYVLPSLKKKIIEGDETYIIEDVLLQKLEIGPELHQMINSDVLFPIGQYIDKDPRNNGLTSNMLLCATNMLRQFAIAIHFYVKMMLPPDNVNQDDVYVEDALAYSAWVDQIYRDLKKVPIGKIKCSDNSIHDVHIGVGAAISCGYDPFVGHNVLNPCNQIPALYIE